MLWGGEWWRAVAVVVEVFVFAIFSVFVWRFLKICDERGVDSS
jgi:hypothetical protein